MNTTRSMAAAVISPRLLPVIYLLMFLYGTQATIIGVVLPSLIADLAITKGAGGFLVTAQAIGGIGALALIVAAAERLPRRGVVFVSFLLIGATSAIAGLSPGYALAAVAFILLGAAMRLFDAMANTCVGELASSRRNRSMNLLHTSFAFGAMAGPLIAQLAQNLTDDWRTIYLVGGAVSILTLPLLYRITRARPGDPSVPPFGVPGDGRLVAAGSPSGARRSLLADPVLMFTAVALALYASHQASMTAWLPLLFESTGSLGTGASGTAISIYWVGIILGRIGGSRLPDRTDRLAMIASGSVAGAIATVAVILTAHRSPLSLGLVLLSGASCGALIPLSISEGQSRNPAATGTITALFSLFLLAGRFVGPWVIGAVADSVGIRSALYAAAAVLAGCVASSLTARAFGRRTAVDRVSV